MNKVCYFNLTTYSQTGGIENFNKTFLKALDNLNIKTTSISIYDEVSNGNFKNIEFENFNKNKVKASLYLLQNIKRTDIIIVAHINLLPIVMIAKIFKPSLKIYLSIYGIEVWKKLPFLYRKFLSKIKILSISKYTTEKFKIYNDCKKKNIYYLPPDTDIDIKDDFKNVYNKKEFNILSVTRLDSNDSYKGVDSMIQTIPLLIETIPNIKYTIIGKGNDKERLEKLAKKLNVEKYIDFKGFVEYIEPYYQYCDVFILPSKGEGFGIVYIEAMKYKKPCIACNEGGQTDVVIDGYNGLLCPYNNIKCLNNSIKKLYMDKNLRHKFGESGYKHVLENFTYEKFKERLKEILND